MSREDPDLTFPTLAVCSNDGIRLEKMAEDLGIESGFWSLDHGSKNMTIWPNDKTVLNAWYDKSTFSKGDIIKAVE